MLKAYFQLARYNDNGLIKKTRKKLSRSFVKGFMQMLYAAFGNASINAITNKNELIAIYTDAFGGGSSFGGSTIFDSNQSIPSSGFLVTTGYANGDFLGIVVGTGTTPVDIADAYVLIPIEDGTSTSQLEYLGSSGYGYTVSDPNASFVLERYFRNSSGGTITINEVGVCISNDKHSYLVIRDIVSPGEAVGNGEYLKITYTIQITA